MKPKNKADQHPTKPQSTSGFSPGAPKTTGTPPPPQSNPDHSVPDVRATTENAPGPNEQQQG